MISIIVEAINGARMKGLTPICILIGFDTMMRLFAEIPMTNKNTKQTIDDWKEKKTYGVFYGVKIEKSEEFDFGFVIVTKETRSEE